MPTGVSRTPGVTRPRTSSDVASVRLNLIAQLVDSYLGLILQIASAAIIARLLSPNEIGIFSVAAVIAAVASQFRDFGLGEYLIQEHELTPRKVRAAMAANIITSWLMALVFVATSWHVAEFYRQPGVGQVMRLQAVNFLIVPFGAVTMAYFRRELSYRPILIASIFANMASFTVAVGGALLGLSYMSLAWSTLCGLVVTVAVSMWFRPSELPRWPALSGLLDVVAFSKHAMGIYFVEQIGKGAPEAVIGRVMDMASVAFFSRANGLMEIFNRTVLRAVLPVCLPFFARSARAGESTIPGYLKATTLLTGVGWPFFLVVGALAFSVIRLLYGAQWEAATHIAQILSLAAVIELPYWLTKEVMIAVGRIDQANRLQFCVQGFRVLGLALVFPFGLSGACWGLVVAGVAGGFVSQRFLRAAIGLRLRDLARACLPSAIVSLGTAAPVLATTMLVQQTHANYLWFLAFGTMLATVMWLILLCVMRHPFWHEILHLCSSIVARFRSTASL